MSQTAIDCSVMRGGTSKGLVFAAADLPLDTSTRDAVLLAALGSPDPRQIDGLGGAHPLTSKVAVVGPSARTDADVDYLFLQVWPDRTDVADSQNCGNMLAAVGPFAIEQGMVAARDGETPVRIWMQNTDSVAVARISTPGRHVEYQGDATIDGVPGRHAPVPLEFVGIAGASCGALLPTGRVSDLVDGVEVTMIDHGMPVVCLRAGDIGLTGAESPAEIEADTQATARIERIRLAAGPMMNLGDVNRASVPKMTLLSSPSGTGAVATRTLIPHRVHEAIGVLGAVSVATACAIPGSVAHSVAAAARRLPGTYHGPVDIDVEHPTGYFTVTLDVASDPSQPGGAAVRGAALLRTARLLMRGHVMVPNSVWSGP